jgi:hypothetical protein
MRAHYPTPDPSLLLREDGILVRRAAELEAGHVHDEGLSSALSVGFGRGLAFMSDTFGNGLGGVSEGQQQQYEKARKVFEKAPEFGDFFEFAFAVGDLLGWTESHDPMLAQVKAIDRLLHGYFTQVDNAIFASWSATRLAMLADLHAQAAAARETIRSIVANQDDLSDPLTVARLAHADRDSLVAVSALTAGLEGGYWLRPYSGPAVGLDDWGLRFEDRAPVLADGTVWDPRLALPTLMYALCVRVCVLRTRLQMFSDAVKALGEICALVSRSAPVVDAYRRGLRTVRDRAVLMPGSDPKSRERADLAGGLASLLHRRRDRGGDAAMRDRFDVFCALQDDDGPLATELRAVVRAHLGQGAGPLENSSRSSSSAP